MKFYLKLAFLLLLLSSCTSFTPPDRLHGTWYREGINPFNETLVQIIRFEENKIYYKTYLKDKPSDADFIEYDNWVFSEYHSDGEKYIIEAWAPVDNEPCYYIYILEGNQLLVYISFNEINIDGEPRIFNRY